jgi:hypothetical protein
MRFLPPPVWNHGDLTASFIGKGPGPSGASFGGSSGRDGRRTLPLLLDLFTAIGSSRARALLYETGEDDYATFDGAVSRARGAWRLRESREGEASLRTVLLRAIAGAFTPASAGHPTFMTAPAYGDRAVLSAHAAYLLTRVVRFPAAGESGRPASADGAAAPAVYVEPLRSLYSRLGAALTLLRRGLKAVGYPLADPARLQAAADALARLDRIAETELADHPLPPDDERFARDFAAARLPMLRGFHASVAAERLVACDPEAGRCRIGATGPFHLLVAVCPLPDGRYVACAGPVVAYRDALLQSGSEPEADVPFWSHTFWAGAPPPPTPTPSPKKKASRSLPPAR